jgi:hypothetical protein
MINRWPVHAFLGLVLLPFACSSKAEPGSTSSSQSVLERNKNPSRDGHFVQPTLTLTAAATMALDAGFAATFTGSMWASPLYVENGPGGAGAFIAVTTGNDVFALHETTGATLWTRNIGSSPQQSGAGCGNIHPIGIESTPVIDGATRTLYVAGAIGSSAITRHEVHALAIEDGAPRAGWPVDVSTMTAGGLTFMPQPQNQRSALSLVGGVLYVAYGGHVGDCGAYHGWVVGINAANPATRGAWATGGQGEGIWASGGMASDGNGVIAMTGNRTGGGSSTHLDSEEVVRITGTGTRADAFWPASWQTMDSQDADLGSNSPVYLELPGSTPSKVVVAISKDGHMYLIDAGDFGGMAGHKVDFKVATGAMAVKTAPAAYRTAMGTYVVFSVESGAACPSGGSGKSVVAVRLGAGSPPTPTVAWCAALSGETTSPIATTTDGQANPIVWYLSDGKLTGVDGDTGAAVFSSGNGGSCSGARRWTSPIAVKGRIVAGGDGHLCSWSPR